MPENRVILCLNSGSSSLKFTLYRLAEREEALVNGAVERIGVAGSRVWARDNKGSSVLNEQRPFASHREALVALFHVFQGGRFPKPETAGHRVVHGGPDHLKPERITPELIGDLQRCVPLAPLHLPAQIQVMEFVTAAEPSLPQVACFDTGFHRTMPEVAQRFPLPRRFWDEGMRRYGFHGLSFEYVVGALGGASKGAIIIAHLGNGASLAAVRDGQPMDTTMALTPTAGLMMGTRTGDLDPGALFYLMNEKGYDPARLAHLVNEESGLLGVSAITSDMKRLIDTSSSDPRAAQALELFCYLARKQIGAMAAALGGLDLLVFTGGIGEHAAPIREKICSGLGFLGIEFDAARNDQHADVISRDGTRCAVRVIPTNEDLMIARHTRRVAFGDS